MYVACIYIVNHKSLLRMYILVGKYVSPKLKYIYEKKSILVIICVSNGLENVRNIPLGCLNTQLTGFYLTFCQIP